MKTTHPPVYTERFKTKRGTIERRYVVKTVMPVEALRLCEDIAAIKQAIAHIQSLWPDNIKPVNSVDDRREADMDIWNEVDVLQRWLRHAEDLMRHRFLKNEIPKETK